MAEYLMEDYEITLMPDGSYSVYHDHLGEKGPYTVRIVKGNGKMVVDCDCPHYRYRLSAAGVKCKHIEEVIKRGAWNESQVGRA